MSSDKGNGSNVDSSQTDSSSSTDQAAEFVNRKAYEEVSKDMHKFKAKAREMEAAKSEYEAKLKAIEEQTLMEQKRWQELYEKEKQDKERIAGEAKAKHDAYLQSVKKSALKNELGGKLKDTFLIHADISKIEINEDGTLNLDSVHAVANKFRQEFPELIPQSQASDATSNASPVGQTIGSGEKPIEQMSGQEAYDMLLRRTALPTNYRS